MKRHEVKKRPLSPAALAVLRWMGKGWTLSAGWDNRTKGVRNVLESPGGSEETVSTATIKTLLSRSLIVSQGVPPIRYTLTAAGRAAAGKENES